MTATTWAIDPVHSAAEFDLMHMQVSTFRSGFRIVQGTLVFDEANPANSKVQAKIDARSINVDDKPLLDRLMDQEFFFVTQHPYITFESTSVEKVDATHYRAKGNLGIRGVERPVTLEIEALGGANHPFARLPMKAFRATTSINRGDFGMKWNAVLDTGAAYLGEKVNITLQIELLKQEEAK